MSYICRDCGQAVKSDRHTATCPQCRSIYLIPPDFKPDTTRKELSITFSERLLSLLFGAVGGLLTFFLWGIAILFRGFYLAANAAEGAFLLGLKYSLIMGAGLGIIGYFLGEEKLTRLLGVLWNTDKLDDQIYKVLCRIPLWIGYVVSAIAIVGSFGYIFTLV